MKVRAFFAAATLVVASGCCVTGRAPLEDAGPPPPPPPPYVEATPPPPECGGYRDGERQGVSDGTRAPVSGWCVASGASNLVLPGIGCMGLYDVENRVGVRVPVGAECDPAFQAGYSDGYVKTVRSRRSDAILWGGVTAFGIWGLLLILSAVASGTGAGHGGGGFGNDASAPGDPKGAPVLRW